MKDNIYKILQQIKKAIYKLNKLLSDYKAIVETIGIFTGLLLLYYTYRTVDISQATLKFNQEQYIQQQLPVWAFEVNEKEETIHLKSVTPGLNLEQATAIYPKDYFDGEIVWPIDPPDFKWYVTTLKYFLSELVIKFIDYNPDTYAIGERGGYPVILDINYSHLGESRKVTGLFIVQFGLFRSSRYDVKININGIHFVKYLTRSEDKQSILYEWCMKAGFKKIVKK